ncbi:MAG: MotA/TolQ/ExbB proton channel family protein [Verrucomicrobia bacterium]|nr:MotA/TolQ/ExbB proton channel family protein [Verrucomicrobiota bacterium]
MTPFLTWFASGGTVTLALTAVGVVLAFLLVERFWAAETRMRALARGRSSTPAPMGVGRDLAGSRRMAVIRACITIAPLLGLLGTVSGIIHTFQDIAAGGYLLDMSAGISQALYTTEHGLAIAVPGLLAERFLMQRLEKLASLTAIAARKPAEEHP